MKHVLLDPGMLPLSQLKTTFENFSKVNNLTLITEKRRKTQFLEADLSCKTLYYEDFEIVNKNKLEEDYGLKYNFVLTTVLSDQRTLLIAERVHKIFAWNSLFSITSVIEKIVFNSLFYFQNNQIDFMLFQATPHNLPNWVMAKVAEAINIPVRMIQTSPLPWRYWIVEGLDIQKLIFPIENKVTEFDTNLLNDYIKLNQADYTKALPEYEKKRLDSRKGKFWSWKKEIIDIFKNPKLAINLPTKRKLFKLYDSLAVLPDLNKKYLVFFLHFQPERTSMPEGLEFSNQWFIIRMISENLPKGWRLLVKEHPSTYTNHLDFRYRSSKFYEDIVSLNNVELVKLDFNTFDLIDYSHGIVTITGTVGVQALIRNKPVLVFGVASYRNLNSVYFIKTINDLKNAFLYLLKINSENYKNLDIKELRSVNSISINGISQENMKQDANFYKSEYRINGHIKILKKLLINYDDV